MQLSRSPGLCQNLIADAGTKTTRKRDQLLLQPLSLALLLFSLPAGGSTPQPRHVLITGKYFPKKLFQHSSATKEAPSLCSSQIKWIGIGMERWMGTWAPSCSLFPVPLERRDKSSAEERQGVEKVEIRTRNNNFDAVFGSLSDTVNVTA